jgi:ferredoxin
MAFVDELREAGPAVHLYPQDEVGLIDLRFLDEHRLGAAVYACGPEPMLAAVTERHSQHWPTETLHVERFSAPARDATSTDDTPFELVLARTGHSVIVEPGVSVLESMTRAGVSVEADCREGVCGTCEQTVLEGTVDHRDFVLTAHERNEDRSMMVCVSRCTRSSARHRCL